MNVLSTYPPNFAAVHKFFRLKGRPDVVFAYAPHIYNPSGRPLPADVVAHEHVHLSRQGDNPKEWWRRYMNEPVFRFEEEVLAYRAQLDVLGETLNLKDWKKALDRICTVASGPMYGRMTTAVGMKDAILSRSWSPRHS